MHNFSLVPNLGFKEEFTRFCKRLGGSVKENLGVVSCVNIRAPLKEVLVEYMKMIDKSKDSTEVLGGQWLVEGVDVETDKPFTIDLDIPREKFRITIGDIVEFKAKLPRKLNEFKIKLD